MKSQEKEQLKKIILKRNELYELQGSRLRRLLKDPVRTFTYYVMQYVGYIKPYKVNYTTLWGSKMSFYLPEGGMVYYYGFWEANLANFFINFLKEGDTVFDIGAHVGYYSVLASDLVGEKGHVYSFEPTPRTFNNLQENASHKKNITPYNKAILDKETTIDFFDYGPKYSAFNSFKKRVAEEIVFRNDAEKISVQTLSIDKFCKTHNVSPDFIKIDAEGAEYLILQAMEFVLENNKPVISIEVSTQKEWLVGLHEAYKIFKKYNYICYEITLEGFLVEANPHEPRFYDNLIFLHPSKLTKVQHLII